MARTLINAAEQVMANTVTRALINTATAGSALITRVLPGTGVTLTSTGADAGTGDVTINAASGVTGAAVIDFGTSGATNTSTLVAGQSGILTTSEVDAWIVASASADHSADEHVVENIRVRAGNVVAGTGFTIYAAAPDYPLYGKWTVNWSWN